MERNLILKGNLCYSQDSKNLIMAKNSFLICENGKSVGIFQKIPEKYQNFIIKY